MDAVVAQVAHAAEDDGLGKLAGPLRIPGAQLAQQRDQGVADQRVHLIQQQHQRPRIGRAPVLEQGGQHPIRTPPVPGLIGPRRQAVIAQVPMRGGLDRTTDSAHTAGHILARGLGRFKIGIHRTIAPLAIEVLHQGQQTGGFTGLARGVQEKVFLPVEPVKNFVQVPTGQGRQAVMIGGPDRTLGVEKTHRVHKDKGDGISIVRPGHAPPLSAFMQDYALTRLYARRREERQEAELKEILKQGVQFHPTFRQALWAEVRAGGGPTFAVAAPLRLPVDVHPPLTEVDDPDFRDAVASIQR